MLIQIRLKEVLHYDLCSGEFIWRKSVGASLKGSTAGSCHIKGYVQIQIDGKLYLAHRLAFLYVNGVWPNIVDHKNRDVADNRWNNLRECTVNQNSMNRKRASNNTSGVVGVYRRRDTDKWTARIKIDGKNKHLGCFDSKREATIVRTAAERELFGEFQLQSQLT